MPEILHTCVFFLYYKSIINALSKNCMPINLILWYCSTYFMTNVCIFLYRDVGNGFVLYTCIGDVMHTQPHNMLQL